MPFKPYTVCAAYDCPGHKGKPSWVYDKELDEAAHERDDNPMQAALLREWANSLW